MIKLAFYSVFATTLVASINPDAFLFVPFESKPVPSCPPNEIYKFCHGNCSTCTERGLCKVNKCTEGCDCAPHFFRLSEGGTCLPVEKCPIPECGENEVFRSCGPMCERCKTFKCQSFSCDHKCYCKSGYLRDDAGNCILEEECPQRVRCSRTEQWADSGPADEFCMRASNETTDEIQNRTQCYCKDGYKRSGLGICVEEPRCANIRCFLNETFYKSVPKCNTTCHNKGDPNCEEDEENCFSGCFCKPGMLTNDFRQCVEPDDCPKDMLHEMTADQNSSTTEAPENATTVEPDIATVSGDDTTITDIPTIEASSMSPDLQKTSSDSSADGSEVSASPESTTEAQGPTKSMEKDTEENYDFDNEFF